MLVIVYRRMKKKKKLERLRSTAELACVQGPPVEVGRLAVDVPRAVESVACVRHSVNNAAPCGPTAVALSDSPKRVASHLRISGQGTPEHYPNPGLNCEL